jgi:hypothetical protein
MMTNLEEKGEEADIGDPRNTCCFCLHPDFQQQKLRAWQPLMTPGWVQIAFVIIGVICIPLGAGVVSTNNMITEISQRYDDQCGTSPKCEINFNITETMKAPIYFYYRLENFFQNHRNYYKDRSDNQLTGQNPVDISACSLKELTINGTAKSMYPCGMVAYSVFNDTFTATVISKTGKSELLGANDWNSANIAWDSDVEKRFRDVDDLHKPLPAGFTRFNFHDNEPLDISDPDFITWMRTAGLPTFRKLYRVIGNRDLMAGDTLKITISNRFPVSFFKGGTKGVVLTTSSWIGGKQEFMGYCYLAVGAFAFVSAIVLLILEKTVPPVLGNMAVYSDSKR